MALPGTGTIWMNGALVPWRDANLHIAAHVIHYGSAVFEGLRCYATRGGPAFFRLEPHMRRLYDSARIYRMQPPHDREALTGAVHATVRANGFPSCYVRPLIYRGYGSLGVNPLPCPVDCAVIAWEWQPEREQAEHGIDVCVSSWRRPAPDTFPTFAKSSANYANSQLIKLEALAHGYAEAIALDIDGHLGEGSAQNLFLVRDGALHTPPLTASILPGITRDCVLVLAREQGLAVREEPLAREFLYVADEAFLTGTAAEIVPVCSADRIPIGSGRPGPHTRRIQAAFQALLSGEAPDRHGWLTPLGES